MIPAIIFLFLLTSSRLLGGVMVPEEPIQNNITPQVVETRGQDTIQAVATYDIRARVLHVKHYHDDISYLAPLDLALGWKEMSSNKLLHFLLITQKGRFYYWQPYNRDYPRKTIETQSANNHLIPANASIKEQLMNIKQNDIIELKGYLVNVSNAKYDDAWKSSLTREDTGDGACEIVYVTSVNVETIHRDEKP